MQKVNNDDQLPYQSLVMSNVKPTSAAVSPHSPASTGILRSLDAEANRAAEGLRVIEDYVRFVLDDAHLTRLAKELRHELTTALRVIPAVERLAARESSADVGAVLAPPPGSERATAADVAAASFQRLQQALRSLEEYSKLIDPAVAAQVEKIRFRSYTLQRAVGLTADALERLANSRLYVLVDASTNPISANEETFIGLIKKIVAAGVHVIQLRDKQLPDAQLLARARIVREITRHSSTLFIMNDRPDLARLSGADGVHVGQDELSVKDARAIVGPHALIGVSTHNIQQARQAVLDGANYIGVGPTFPSGTKKFDSFAGLDFVRAVAAEIALPAFAIGGITLDNVSQVISADLRRVALSGAIISAPNPTTATKDFLAKLGSG
jgi:thiamine-phosphate pyrophosphorylase